LAFRKLSKEQVAAINYSAFHDLLGIAPTLAEADRPEFPLDQLQYATLGSSPDWPKEQAARALRKLYDSGGFAISDPTSYLVDPRDRTLDDLAKFIQRRHVPKFSSRLGTE